MRKGMHYLLILDSVRKVSIRIWEAHDRFMGHMHIWRRKDNSKSGHGKSVDWYLLGVIFYEMLTGMPPYYADDKYKLLFV